MRLRCSAVSRVPFGGALDTASAPCVACALIAGPSCTRPGASLDSSPTGVARLAAHGTRTAGPQVNATPEGAGLGTLFLPLAAVDDEEPSGWSRDSRRARTATAVARSVDLVNRHSRRKDPIMASRAEKTHEGCTRTRTKKSGGVGEGSRRPASNSPAESPRLPVQLFAAERDHRIDLGRAARG